MAFLETAASAGLVVAGEAVVIMRAVIAGQGHVDVPALLALTWFFAVSGDVPSYLLGRRPECRLRLAHSPRVQLTEVRLLRVDEGRGNRFGIPILV
ncbi:MAG: hypothetical protein ACTHMY_24400 [Solirubrobacteraceae bacterium]